MMELPESHVIAHQLNQTIIGKTVSNVITNASPHRFAFYFGDPAAYEAMLKGKSIGQIHPIGGQVELYAEDIRIVLGEAPNIRFLPQGTPPPAKHQLYIGFTDGTAIACTAQMYAGLYVFPDGLNNHFYYRICKEKPTPFSKEFDETYFLQLFEETKKSLTVKAFLATEQRIPGLGNGVLQDILFRASINPKSKLQCLTEEEVARLYHSVKNTLTEMKEKNGRDTEKDIFGRPGNYPMILSNKTWKEPCPVCGSAITRQGFLGGNVYYCPQCQPIKK